MKGLLFIYNAHSGKAQIRNHLADIIDLFVKAGYFVEAYPTQRTKDAKRQILMQGQYFDRIVVAGGDGTLNESISGMLKLNKKVPLGYIPCGSTNDFANSIQVPGDIIRAARLAVNGTPVYLDVGGFNRKKFVYVAAFGAFAGVSYDTPQEMKNLFGHTAYILEGIKQLGNIMDGYHMRVETEDGHSVEDDFIYGMITNSMSVGGFKGITGRDILLDDGLFEVMLLRKPKNPMELQEIASCMLTQKRCKNIVKFKTSKLKIFSPQRVKWTLDGEYGGNPKRIVLRNYERAVKLITGLPITGKREMIRKVKETFSWSQFHD